MKTIVLRVRRTQRKAARISRRTHRNICSVIFNRSQQPTPKKQRGLLPFVTRGHTCVEHLSLEVRLRFPPLDETVFYVRHPVSTFGRLSLRVQLPLPGDSLRPDGDFLDS